MLDDALIFRNLTNNLQDNSTQNVEIIILMGPPCSGKSTLSELLAKKYGYNIISMDMIRSHYHPEIRHNPLINASVFNILHQLTEYTLSNNISCTYEGIFHSKENRQKILTTASNSIFRFLFIDAALDTLLARRSKRVALQDGDNIISISRIKEFYYALDRPSLESLVVDTTAKKISRSFSELENKLFSRETNFKEHFHKLI